MKEQNNRIVRKEKYNIAGLKVLMTTYYEETYKRAEKYIAKDENWDEKEADIVIDLGNETYEKIYDEYICFRQIAAPGNQLIQGCGWNILKIKLI